MDRVKNKNSFLEKKAVFYFKYPAAQISKNEKSPQRGFFIENINMINLGIDINSPFPSNARQYPESCDKSFDQ